MTKTIDDLLFIIGFIFIGTSMAIPLIQWMAARTKSEKIKHVQLWALQVVENVNGISGAITGDEKKEKAVSQLDDIVRRTSQKYNMGSKDLERYVQSAYELLKAEGKLNDYSAKGLPLASEEEQPTYLSGECKDCPIARPVIDKDVNDG